MYQWDYFITPFFSPQNPGLHAWYNWISLGFVWQGKLKLPDRKRRKPRGLRLISCLRESNTLFCRILLLLTSEGRSKRRDWISGERERFTYSEQIVLLHLLGTDHATCKHSKCLSALSPTILYFEKSAVRLLRGREYLGSSVSSAPTENNWF